MDSNNIIEFKNTLPHTLCDLLIDIICESSNENVLKIKKKDELTKKVEVLIYKELLKKINIYKSHILNLIHIEDYSVLYTKLYNSLNTKDFVIYKCTKDFKFTKNISRNNLLTYIFFLDEIPSRIVFSSFDYIVHSEKGKLVLFYENIDYPYKYIIDEYPQYILYGQLYY